MVYGVTLISKALEKNTNVTGLNLFKNTFDVDFNDSVKLYLMLMIW